MNILIADDHALFRDSLRSLLEARGGSRIRARGSGWRSGAPSSGRRC